MLSNSRSNSIIQDIKNIKDETPRHSLNSCSKGICPQKNQHSLITKPQRNMYSSNSKTLLKLEIEGNVLYLIKDTENVTMLKLWNVYFFKQHQEETRMSTITASINHCIWCLCQYNIKRNASHFSYWLIFLLSFITNLFLNYVLSFQFFYSYFFYMEINKNHPNETEERRFIQSLL